MTDSTTTHVDYPHEAGRLHDCPACEARCHCQGSDPASVTACVYEGAHVWKVTRRNGVAGSYSVSALVSHDDDPDEPASGVTFYGSTYGGPIVMALPSGAQVFVSSAVTDRIGNTLSESWVRAFFGSAA